MARVIESFDQLRQMVGQEVGVSKWVEVTQERINAFADATDDHQWIHIDSRRAKEDSPYHRTVAHGFLTLSLLSGFWHQAVEMPTGSEMKINYGLNRVRFPAPVAVRIEDPGPFWVAVSQRFRWRSFKSPGR